MTLGRPPAMEPPPCAQRTQMHTLMGAERKGGVGRGARAGTRQPPSHTTQFPGRSCNGVAHKPAWRAGWRPVQPRLRQTPLTTRRPPMHAHNAGTSRARVGNPTAKPRCSHGARAKAFTHPMHFCRAVDPPQLLLGRRTVQDELEVGLTRVLAGCSCRLQTYSTVAS